MVARRRRTVREGNMILSGGGVCVLWRLVTLLGESKVASMWAVGVSEVVAERFLSDAVLLCSLGRCLLQMILLFSGKMKGR